VVLAVAGDFRLWLWPSQWMSPQKRGAIKGVKINQLLEKNAL